MHCLLVLYLLASQILGVFPHSVKSLEHWLYHSELENTTLALLDRPDIIGVQLLYSWKSPEPAQDEYDFSNIEGDLALVQIKGKMLWVQLQDRSFFLGNIPTPKYMEQPLYYNGSFATCDGNNCAANFPQAGWMAPQ